MKNKTEKPDSNMRKRQEEIVKNDLFELCVKKGLIEKTEYGYYFKPEFFETLEIYEDG